VGIVSESFYIPGGISRLHESMWEITASSSVYLHKV
jgi:hypothetical protein